MVENKEMGRKGRGLSMDLGMHNPYLLPPEVHQSRESLHSLSRLNTGDDKYRATTFIPDDGSIRPSSSSRSPVDDASSYTGSSLRYQYDSKQNLLRSGQDNPTGGRNGSPDIVPINPKLARSNLLAPTTVDATRESYVSTTSSTGAITALRASNNYLGQFISGGNGRPNEDLYKQETATTVAEIRVEPPAEEVRAPPPAVVKEPRYDGLSVAPASAPSHQPKLSDAPSITVSQAEE
ncbi:hypothetical protein LTR40_012744, partial [Exophiala xenobiotica]